MVHKVESYQVLTPVKTVTFRMPEADSTLSLSIFISPLIISTFEPSCTLSCCVDTFASQLTQAHILMLFHALKRRQKEIDRNKKAERTRTL